LVDGASVGRGGVAGGKEATPSFEIAVGGSGIIDGSKKRLISKADEEKKRLSKKHNQRESVSLCQANK